jgi:hypothetical protein
MRLARARNAAIKAELIKPKGDRFIPGPVMKEVDDLAGVL